MNKKKGVTLIELIVVVAILSIILSLAMPRTDGLDIYDIKSKINTKQIILYDAIDYWKKENYNTKEILTNITKQKNSQNNVVLDYISDPDFFDNTNIIRNKTGSGKNSRYTYVLLPENSTNINGASVNNNTIFFIEKNSKVEVSTVKNRTLSTDNNRKVTVDLNKKIN